MHGILSQGIVILYCLGWNPVRFDKWVSPTKEEWEIPAVSDIAFPISDMITELTDSYHKHQIVQALKHYDGSSLRSPVCWNLVTNRNRALRNKKIYAEACILETVQAGNRALICEHHIASPVGLLPLEQYVLFSEVVQPNTKVVR